MTTSLLLPVLGASVVGSLHCAGMCGPLVAVAVGAASHLGKLRPQLVAVHGQVTNVVQLLPAVQWHYGLLDAAVRRGRLHQ